MGRQGLFADPRYAEAMPGILQADAVVVPDPAEASALRNKGFFGEPQPGGGLRLTLLEAVYLRDAGRLEVVRDGRPASARDLLRTANRAHPGFEVRYIVYRDLRQRGYVAEEDEPPIDFRVYPRGGGPKRTPSKYWVTALSERAVFDLDALMAHASRSAGVRKEVLLAVVDEESDLTYYAVREATPHGKQAEGPGAGDIVAHLLEDRAVVLDPDDARALHDSGFFGRMSGPRLQLSLLETAYLATRDAVQVRNARTGRRVGLASLLRTAKRVQPDFELRLRVYQDLKARGIVPKTGFKYGSHFRAYVGDPETQHAKYLVHALPAHFRGMWPEVSRAIRLAHGVRKHILFGAVGDAVRYVRLERVRP